MTSGAAILHLNELNEGFVSQEPCSSIDISCSPTETFKVQISPPLTIGLSKEI
jgi:hypothetical protein